MTPRLPRGSSSPPPQDRSGGTLLALVAVVSIAGGLLGLISMIVPQARGIVLVVAGMCLFVALHYFIWGRWLMNMSERPEETDAWGDDVDEA